MTTTGKHIIEQDEWTQIIKPATPWFDLRLKDLWKYKDLLILFVKRDFTAIYKQTILGPLWFVLQPLLTTFIFVLVFSKGARIPTDGVPAPVFYLSGLVAWNYFSTCLQTTAGTFTTNAALFSKVYFPRLIVPLSGVITAFISFGIQILMLIIIIGYYYFFRGMDFHFTAYLLSVFFLIPLIAALGLGWGLIIAALTTKYKDLSLLITFGVQLLLYITPVIYPLSFFSEKYKTLLLFNPLAPIVEMFRYAFLGVGDGMVGNIYYSIVITFLSLIAGIILFNRVEKTFTDVI